MEFAWYIVLYYYLLDGSYPDGASKVMKQKIRRHASKLEIRHENLIDKETGKQVLHEGNVRKVLVQLHEESHLGVKHLYAQANDHFIYHMKLYSACQDICKECVTCQMRARPVFKRTNKARPILNITSPFFMVAVDAVGPLEITSNKNRYILTAIDYMTRWPVALAVPDINEVTTTEFYFNCIIQHYGVSQYILSDRGANFISTYTKQFLYQMGCKSISTTSFRANVNGLCERLNQSPCRTIAKLARDKVETHEWDKFVNPAFYLF